MRKANNADAMVTSSIISPLSQLVTWPVLRHSLLHRQVQDGTFPIYAYNACNLLFLTCSTAASFRVYNNYHVLGVSEQVPRPPFSVHIYQ